MSDPSSAVFGLSASASVAAAVGATLVGALFAGAESAISALSGTRLAALLDQDEVEQREALERIRDDGEALHAAYLAGRIAAAATVTVVLAPPILSRAPGSLGVPVTILASTILLAPAFLIAAAIGRERADDAAALVRWLRPIELLLWPLAWPLARLAVRFADRAQDDSPITETDKRIAEAEVEFMVDRVEEAGLVGAEPAEMIRNVLEFADLQARDVMVPRAKVEAFERSTPLAEIRRLVAESGHSRYPVFDRQLDNVVGLLVAKDVFKAELEPAVPGKLSDLVRTPVNFVHESQSLLSLLREMRGKRQHMAIVVDEFGGVSGIVTLEDVLEEIVGDIHDEHDEVEPAPIRDLGDGRLLAEADVSLDDLSTYLGAELPEDRRFVSLGGLLMHHTGGVPEVGASLEKYGFRFIVRGADDTRVETVEIIRQTPSSVPPGSVPPGSVPPGAVPPGAVPPGAVPPGAVPPSESPPPGSEQPAGAEAGGGPPTEPRPSRRAQLTSTS